MKFSFKTWWAAYLLLVLLAFIPLSTASATALTDEATDVPVHKEWTITFSFPVVESSVTPGSIYVMNSEHEKQPVSTSVEGKVVIVHAPEAGYEPNEKYTLHITTDISGQVGEEVKTLKESIVKPFTTTKGYTIVTIEDDGTYSPVSHHATFDEANTQLENGQGIMLDGKLVKIQSGFVATNTRAVTEVFKKPVFTSQYQYTGVATDTEMLYVDATDDYVKVHAFGEDMYVQHKDITLIPSAAAKGQSYYKADSQGLWHDVYRHHAKRHDGAYPVGKKPDFLNEGIPYYSTDGIHFTTVDGKSVGESHAYFQYMSPRVPTNYSAAELDAYIYTQLAAKEQTGGRYTDATTKSPLKNLGATLKSIEKEHRINALFILSLAIHESDYGMSCHAQNYNNLFGLTVPDHDAQCSTNVDTTSSKYYATVAKNITALVNQLNAYYVNPLNMEEYRYNGAALGNKMIGMNVRYASDPYWGAKTAGHMYTIDRELGRKDYKRHELGITARPYVSVRTGPGIHYDRAYQYKMDWTIKLLDQMPITLSSIKSEASDWLRVISELPKDGADLYTVTNNVRLLDTH